MKASLVKITFDSESPFHCEYLDLPYFDHPWHFHPELELTLILESDGIRYVGDHTTRFSSGDLVLLGSNLPHLWQNDSDQSKDSTKRSRAIVLQFPKDFIGRIFKEYRALKPIANLFRLAERGVSYSSNISKQVAPMLLEINKQSGLKRWAIIFEMLCVLTETDDYEILAGPYYQPILKNSDTMVMNRLYEHVRIHFKHKITLQEMAEMAYLSKPAFCRYFKRKTSKSFFEFLNEYRIGHAKKMLRDNFSLSIGYIAAQSGFPSIQHFNAQFKKLEGITPKQYRGNTEMTNM
ncbi:AraC family transcriptional regulator [Flagellimonas sp. HMM57]|uniref:AraC family transcriptional regulator n=1 Tax=unclassified Flagellimonas TaxID=2644544 RepID=UPI0013D3ADE9|nr:MULTISPECIES: AraC family transcriptional regulator [unclassified Flagellimonas]UII74765.1 AraC family transcriptional regulator [Flagellimonas sp. HMM57]